MASSIFAAVIPTLTLSSAGGDSVTVGVSADPNATVVLYYNIREFGGRANDDAWHHECKRLFLKCHQRFILWHRLPASAPCYVIVDESTIGSAGIARAHGNPSLNETSVTLTHSANR